MRSVTECPLILPLTQQQPGPVDRQEGKLQLLGRYLHLDSDGIDWGKGLLLALHCTVT